MPSESSADVKLEIGHVWFIGKTGFHLTGTEQTGPNEMGQR